MIEASMNDGVDTARWLLCPSLDTDTSYRPGPGPVEESPRTHRLMSAMLIRRSPVSLSSDHAPIVAWLRGGGDRVALTLQYAGAINYLHWLRRHPMSEVAKTIASAIDRETYLSLLRSRVPTPIVNDEVSGVGSFLTAGGRIMYAYCHRRHPMLATRLQLIFHRRLSESWSHWIDDIEGAECMGEQSMQFAARLTK